MVGTMEEERFARLNHRDSETSLDPTHFRMYASGQGRWLSPDLLMGHPFNPQTFDRYSYAGGNPISRTDPEGLEFCPAYSAYYDSFGNLVGYNSSDCVDDELYFWYLQYSGVIYDYVPAQTVTVSSGTNLSFGTCAAFTFVTIGLGVGGFVIPGAEPFIEPIVFGLGYITATGCL
jgi:RHS repeat-associated protein